MAKKAIFLGSKPFGLKILKLLIKANRSLEWTVLHPDDEDDSRSSLSEFKDFCGSKNLTLAKVGRARLANEFITDCGPDFVFVCGWYFLIPEKVLNSGPAFYGVHNSLLPKYRGGAPLVWAMINGERKIGSTLFGITPGMDDGPVFLQVSTQVATDDQVSEVLERLENKFTVALPNVWQEISSGANVGSEQNHDQATYCGQRIPADGLINWEQKAEIVHNFIRAQTAPYPGAFTQGLSGPIYIWQSAISPKAYCGTPGQVLERKKDFILISCGENTALQLLRASDASGETDLMKVFPSLSVRLVNSY